MKENEYAPSQHVLYPTSIQDKIGMGTVNLLAEIQISQMQQQWMDRLLMNLMVKISANVFKENLEMSTQVNQGCQELKIWSTILCR